MTAAAPPAAATVTVEVDRFPLQGLLAFVPDLPLVGLAASRSPGRSPSPPTRRCRRGRAPASSTTADASLAARRRWASRRCRSSGPAARAARAGLAARPRSSSSSSSPTASRSSVTGTAGRRRARSQPTCARRARDLDVGEILALVAGVARPRRPALGRGQRHRGPGRRGERSISASHAPRPDQPDLGAASLSAASSCATSTLPAGHRPDRRGPASPATALRSSWRRPRPARSTLDQRRGGAHQPGRRARPQLSSRRTLDAASTVPAALALLDAEPVALGKAHRPAPRTPPGGQQTTKLELSLPLLDGHPGGQDPLPGDDAAHRPAPARGPPGLRSRRAKPLG